jgi:hypothetical protein
MEWAPLLDLCMLLLLWVEAVGYKLYIVKSLVYLSRAKVQRTGGLAVDGDIAGGAAARLRKFRRQPSLQVEGLVIVTTVVMAACTDTSCNGRSDGKKSGLHLEQVFSSAIIVEG